MTNDLYTKLIKLLDKNKAQYKLIDHSPEGQTDIVSKMRGNKLSQAAKCIVMMVKIKKVTKYVLAVIPGDAKVDLEAVKALFNGTYISFATTEIAEELSGSVAGTVLPFSFDPNLELIVDPALLEHDELYFNAARLDRSMALKTSDYIKLAKPRLEPIMQSTKKRSKVKLAPKNNEDLDTMRHSLSHILAQAVLEMFPEANLGIGPTIEDGFYYDFDLPRTLIPEDLRLLEKKMKKIISQAQPFHEETASTKEAKAILKKAKQTYKVELVEDLEKEGAKEVTFYTNKLNDKVTFADLCRGPQLEHTGQAGVFKLMKISGAYWRGDEKRPMLQRIYGVAFKNKKDLNDYLVRLEEAKKRDHRKLGMDLDLYQFHDVSPGAAFYHPKGTVVFNELSNLIRRQYRERDYQEVITPLVYDKALWEQSGHWEHYKENMFCMEVDGIDCSLKPMNCPSHMLMFKMRTRSYRDLPFRIADFAMLHRNEVRGALGGLTRVRKFSMDDAHIFVSLEELGDEIIRCIEFTQHVYDIFGFEYEVVLSTKPEKSMGTDEQWKTAEDALENALKKAKIKYEFNDGDGAFYGPKIDFRIRDCLKREWQCATIQIDFQMPLRFELKYEGKDGQLHTPVVVHRALLGSLERFMAILVEHYAGAFPFWLAPVQMRVLSLSEKFNKYTKQVRDELFEAGYRVDMDVSDQTLGKKIREAETSKIPVMLIVGEKEAKDGTVTARYYGQREQEVMKTSDLIKKYADARP
ncbi:threonine--tRNA ligase [Candidatus Peregrinibacteria bacterium]|jgi:threonyl-tRNA synthetase|nr:threonine--tRNA ligase [Candidatus Peregrinibacteria bacterium]MBT7703459.1 threonine--tRNA ligase [Candidatus Peregrinibacteria bacterium]